jgi:hypothetical protein
MSFRLIVSEAPDLTTIRVVGRLRDDAVAILGDACVGARRPLVLDLSDLTSPSDAGVLLLLRLTGEGVHLLGASHYVRLLLERATDTPSTPAPGRKRGPSATAPAAGPQPRHARPRP